MKTFYCEIHRGNKIHTSILEGKDRQSVAQLIHAAMRNYGYVDMLELGRIGGVPAVVEQRYELFISEVGPEIGVGGNI